MKKVVAPILIQIVYGHLICSPGEFYKYSLIRVQTKHSALPSKHEEFMHAVSDACPVSKIKSKWKLPLKPLRWRPKNFGDREILVSHLPPSETSNGSSPKPVGNLRWLMVFMALFATTIN